MSEQTLTKPQLFVFELVPETKRLQAIYTPDPENQPLNVSEIKQLIAEQGYGDYFLQEKALQELCKLQRKGSTPTTTTIGEQRDGELSITLSEDEMAAYLNISPPYGGQAVTMDLVKAALQQQSIVYGISKIEIECAVKDGKAEQVLIATGKPPIEGVDTQFESSIPAIKNRRPKINDDGTTDYHELGQFITVQSGDSLMRKTPPTNGTAGTSILGKVIPPKPGKELHFTALLPGTIVDERDKNILVASIGGQPILVDNGVRVEPIISMKSVDLSTGNVDFDGTVVINGDVIAGMKVYAKGDIDIHGTVEAADIQAGGDVTVKNGIIGRGEVRQECGALGAGVAHIKSGGTIQARFIENAYLEAATSVTASELIAHSEVYTMNRVIVGKEHAKKGHIMGGIIRATLRVQAQTIGSPAGVKTIVEAGSDPQIRATLTATKKKLHVGFAEQDKLAKILAYLKLHPKPDQPQLPQTVARTLEKAGRDITMLKQKKLDLETEIEHTKGAKIVVGHRVFCGAKITIGNQRQDIFEEKGPGTFHLEENEIVFK